MWINIIFNFNFYHVFQCYMYKDDISGIWLYTGLYIMEFYSHSVPKCWWPQDWPLTADEGKLDLVNYALGQQVQTRQDWMGSLFIALPVGLYVSGKEWLLYLTLWGDGFSYIVSFGAAIVYGTNTWRRLVLGKVSRLCISLTRSSHMLEYSIMLLVQVLLPMAYKIITIIVLPLTGWWQLVWLAIGTLIACRQSIMGSMCVASTGDTK